MGQAVPRAFAPAGEPIVEIMRAPVVPSQNGFGDPSIGNSDSGSMAA
jgi:hypothetical protein